MSSKTTRHPCFSDQARHSVARVHLPVAPACNMQCGFCNRKFDCVNESRPGVTSRILTPDQALEYLTFVGQRLPNLGVVGIAGPGDPLANGRETLETLERIAGSHPDLILCISTNGLELPRYADALADLGVGHVTVTVNAVDPMIGAEIYQWMRYDGRSHSGLEAAATLVERQEQGIRRLHQRGVSVKINMIAIPGVNTHHLEQTARVCHDWGADIANVLSLIPVEGTKFESAPALSGEVLRGIKRSVAEILPLMSHCARCRADAVGILGEDTQLLSQYNTSAEPPASPGAAAVVAGMQAREIGTRAAVATREGFLVNAHLEECESLEVYERTESGWEFVEKRLTPHKGTGETRWQRLARLFADCRVFLLGGIGPIPSKILTEHGVVIIEAAGSITAVLDTWERTGTAGSFKKHTPFSCGTSCAGGGGGCG